MNLFKVLISRKIEEKKENYFDFYLNPQIEKLKNLIIKLSTFRRKDQKNFRIEISCKIFKSLDEIEDMYSRYLKDLRNIKLKSLQTKTSSETAILLEEKNKSLRKDFENIYNNFKRTATGLDDVPMKTILKKMHRAFNFDGRTLNVKIQTKYYDANNEEIKNIIA